MSKKKNTLQDLDAFLKQQAAMLVSPDRLDKKIIEPVLNQPIKESDHSTRSGELSVDTIFRDVKLLSEKEAPDFRQKLYDLIIQSLESQGSITPEDTILINTALYLKHGENWQEGIREYWRKK